MSENKNSLSIKVKLSHMTKFSQKNDIFLLPWFHEWDSNIFIQTLKNALLHARPRSNI